MAASCIHVKQKKANEVSFAKCKEILNKNGNNYTDEEIMRINEFLDILVEIDYHQFIKKLKNEKCDFIH